VDTTVVSLLPWAQNEIKPGLIPEIYRIPESIDGKPAVLHIKDAKSHLYVRDGKTYPITHPAEEVANAVVEDFCRSLLQADDNARPAVFWLPGDLSVEEVLTKHKAELDSAKRKQNAWFMKLIRLADDDWEKTKQHRMITDIQRYAAKSMGLLTKPWMQSVEPQEFIRCPACATLVDMTAAICQNCGFVTNKTKAKELGISESKVAVR